MAKFTERVTSAWRALVRRANSRLPSLRGTRTSAGVNVTPEQSLQVMAVLTSVRLVAEAIATLPVSVVVRRGRDRVAPSPKYRKLVKLLTVQANPVQDAAEFWRVVVTWLLIRGNAYVFVQRNGAGEVEALWPVPPTDVTVLRTPTGQLAYKLNHDGRETWLPVEKGYIATDLEILHYRWFGTGPEALSPIGVARQQVGISVAATSYIGGFFERDATPETVLTTASNLSDKQWERLVAQMEDRHQGFENSHQIAVFEGGAKLERVSLSPADAQFLAIYKLTEGKIASMYGVPPHKIGDLERATFSNIEHLSIEFVQDALLPPITRLEKVTQRLFDDEEMRLKFDPKGRMRGDTAAQTAAYAAGRQWGFYSANDIRAMEDEPPIENGDIYLEPVNMTPAGSSPVQRDGLPPVSIPQLQPTHYRALEQTRRSAVDDAPAWVTRVERTLADFLGDQREQVDAAPSDEERAVWDELLAEQLTPVLAGIVGEFGSRQAETRGDVFIAAQTAHWVDAVAASEARAFNTAAIRLLDKVGDATAFDVMLESVAVWAGRIVTRGGAFGRHEGAVQTGATGKRWRSGDDGMHDSMHGETVAIAAPFSNGAQWPGDLAAGADNAAGCTCSEDFDY
ncbi:phage portal protein [Microbacterium thalli]|uniref:Phage portal protein n=1 Tax=Microbacterium thalli TaxID=3027921 RepID=A0ABT5SKG2_9MICO|nr:phage portal protein [Microbacterium thalli]MDD7963315.1 phage portal protein [Microbacterium thalli]